ncbi:hypothetical protein BU24DRAFT_61780 [Aaosphaeria arxii CBS 175.79]|uniref:Glycoside hydrolase family 16 protein n=1 Tax=Aaosphaeria arxii CBS 175.79 TaxID=1450172 RepID=A0A6A5XCW6_9PLEO|nr:uncharacterized protein BU24DRAFT_61780 [Aaosphaeria arxii CBS 175.79]KAF2010614.1 hypothetical protein BU24DRAFT_61780 [Aaosphaeria arxii CBS 175.79]
MSKATRSRWSGSDGWIWNACLLAALLFLPFDTNTFPCRDDSPSSSPPMKGIEKPGRADTPVEDDHHPGSNQDMDRSSKQEDQEPDYIRLPTPTNEGSSPILDLNARYFEIGWRNVPNSYAWIW